MPLRCEMIVTIRSRVSGVQSFKVMETLNASSLQPLSVRRRRRRRLFELTKTNCALNKYLRARIDFLEMYGS